MSKEKNPYKKVYLYPETHKALDIFRAKNSLTMDQAVFKLLELQNAY